MSLRARVAFIALIVTSLTGIAVWSFAQVQVQRTTDAPVILSGSDVGFQPDGWEGSVRTGKLVVRINGQWVDAKLTGVAPIRVKE